MKLLSILNVFVFVICELDYMYALKYVESITNVSLRIDNNIICTEPKCIMKCCPFGKYLVRSKENKTIGRNLICKDSVNFNKNFTDLVKEVFLTYPEESMLNFTIKPGIFEAYESFKEDAVNLIGFFTLYLTKYPELRVEFRNSFERWHSIPNSKFCWEYKLKNHRKKVVIPGIWMIVPEDDENTFPRCGPDFLNPGGMIITDDTESSDFLDRFLSYAVDVGLLLTCFFLLLVLLVYALLPELRNLPGQILMAYVVSLFSAYLLFYIMGSTRFEAELCPFITYLVYYFFIASFCWLNVMSYDIWTIFRDYTKAPSIHLRSKRPKFIQYCLYAFGLPLIMTIFLIVLNEIDMRHLPWFVTPNVPLQGCFLSGCAKFVYMYVPIVILIVCNWMFYLMTAFHVWRLSRGTAVLFTDTQADARRTHQHRFMVYLKLSAVMGLQWVLVLVQSKYPGRIWLINDFYNILIGFFIFLIFVCKRKIIRKLKKRLTFTQE